MYREACYQYANKLYSEKKPFEALKYYKQILDYRDVSSYRLSKTVYKIMGVWKADKDNIIMEFREDGTCSIDGREYYYTVPNMYSISLGDRPDETAYTYEIVSNNQTHLNLRHIKQKVLYRMTLVKDAEQSAPADE